MSSRTAAGRRRLTQAVPEPNTRPSFSAKGFFKFKNKSSKSLATEPATSVPLQDLNLPNEAPKTYSQHLQYDDDIHSQQFHSPHSSTYHPHIANTEHYVHTMSPTASLKDVYIQDPVYPERPASHIKTSYPPSPPQTPQLPHSPSRSPGRPRSSKVHSPSLHPSSPPPVPPVPPLPPSTSLPRLKTAPFIHRSPNGNRISTEQLLQSTSSIYSQRPLSNDSKYDTVYTAPSFPIPASPSSQSRPSLQVITRVVSDYSGPPSSISRHETSAYPSPPQSHVHLTPSPMNATNLPTGTLAMRASQPNLRSRAEGSRATTASYTHSMSSQSVKSFITFNDAHRHWSPQSIYSNSTSSSVLSLPGAVEPTSAFIFPGSRSTAKPKAKKKGVPELSLPSRSNSRNKHRSPLGEYAPTIRSVSSTDSADVTAGSAPRSPSYATTSVYSRQYSEGALAARVGSQTSHVGSSASSISSPTAFVLPSSRSCAQPTLSLKAVEKRQKREIASQNGENASEKKKIMGLFKKKSKPGRSSGASSSTSSFGDSFVQVPPSSPASTHPKQLGYSDAHSVVVGDSPKAPREKPRIGNYPLDPYDSLLLDNDRHTGVLLARLNPTRSPSFHDYGSNPPSSVLDLGCGQGHWVIDTAIAWKDYGTRVTGYDIVDLSEDLLPWAAEQGVSESIRFIQGNFLKKRLPFSDNSFDLVRMSCLALCITTDSWLFVLQEVCRVLTVGGRLELIDDEALFPYGQPNSADRPKSGSKLAVTPQLDITIPSSPFSTFSIYDSQVVNPGLGVPTDHPVPEENGNTLYGLEEENELDDTATIHETADYNHSQPRAPALQTGFNFKSSKRRRTSHNMPPSSWAKPDLESWNRARETSEGLEALWDVMLARKFGVSINPSKFIIGLIKQVFGQAREVKTMRLGLAPPLDDLAREGMKLRLDDPLLTFGHMRSPASMAAVSSPGLVLEPSTYIPMDPWEIEVHASKHFRVLLSCKAQLVEYALEVRGEDQNDEGSVQDSIEEYERFLKYRLNPPPLAEDPVIPIQQDSKKPNYGHSKTESVTSANLEDMWEIENEFRSHFAWPGNTPVGYSSPLQKKQQPMVYADEDIIIPPVPRRVVASHSVRESDRESMAGRSAAPLQDMIDEDIIPPVPRRVVGPRTRGVRESPVSNVVTVKQSLSGSGPSAAAPASSSHVGSGSAYTPTSTMPHIRTFRVYEAYKLDENMRSMSSF